MGSVLTSSYNKYINLALVLGQIYISSYFIPIFNLYHFLSCVMWKWCCPSETLSTPLLEQSTRLIRSFTYLFLRLVGYHIAYEVFPVNKTLVEVNFNKICDFRLDALFRGELLHFLTSAPLPLLPRLIRIFRWVCIWCVYTLNVYETKNEASDDLMSDNMFGANI